MDNPITPQTAEEIGRVLAVLGLAYPNNRLAAPASIALYVRLLADLPPALLMEAALDHISRSTWFPTIAELRQAAAARLALAAPIPDALAAWEEVRRAVLTTGGRGEPVFSHPLVAGVVQALGWHDLCRSDNLTADRAHFLQAYQARSARAREEALQPPGLAQLAAGLLGGGDPRLAG